MGFQKTFVSDTGKGGIGSEPEEELSSARPADKSEERGPHSLHTKKRAIASTGRGILDEKHAQGRTWWKGG